MKGWRKTCFLARIAALDQLARVPWPGWLGLSGIFAHIFARSFKIPGPNNGTGSHSKNRLEKKCRSKKRVLQIVKIELRWSKFWKIWWDVFVPCLFHVCPMLLLHSPVIGYRLLLLCISCVAAGSEESGISKDQHLQIYRITDFKNYIYIIYIYV